MEWIRPSSSATGMNSSGEIRLVSACRQRISASTPGPQAARLHLRLVVQHELAVPRGLAQALLQAQAPVVAAIMAVENRNTPLPAFLAWYIAMSALCIRAPRSTPSLG